MTNAGTPAPGGKDSGRKRNRVRRTDESVHQQHVDAIKQVFDHDTFRGALIKDMQQAQGRVILHDPYLTSGGAERYAAAISDCIARGVRVCVFIEEPHGWQARNDAVAPEARMRFEKLALAIEQLERLGVHCNMRQGIHEKVAVVDEHVFWEGSLNMLSHFRTSERMIRWASRIEVQRGIAKHRLDQCLKCARLGELAGGEQLRLLGERIMQRRLMLGLTQAQLGRLAGVPQSTICNMELGRREYLVGTLLRVCKALNMQVAQLPMYLAEAVEERVRRCFRAE